MATDLASLGLVPSAEHPDAELFVLTAKLKAQQIAWRDARTDAACRRLLDKWRKDNPVRLDVRIAQFEPATLEGLIEKADSALRSWRDDEGPVRYERIWATMATALEQALHVLQAQRSVVMPDGQRGAA